MAENTPIREICEQFGLTQAALAQRFKIPLRTVQQWCTGRRQAPDYVVAMIKQILETVPVVHGQWIKRPDERICPFCNDRYSYFGGEEKNFCSNCGAKMDL